MSNHLREALFFVKQQHEWLVDLQSVLAEKEQKNKIFYNKLNYQLKKDMKNDKLESYRIKKKTSYEDEEDVYPGYENDEELFDVTNSSSDDVDGRTKVDVENIENQEESLNVKTEIIFDEESFDIKNEAMSDEENYERELDQEQKSSPRTKRKQVGKCFKVKRNIHKPCGNVDGEASDSNDYFDYANVTNTERKNFTKEENKEKQEIPPNKNCENEIAREEESQLQTLNASEKKMFKCKTCGGQFTAKKYLHQHEMIHTGEKPFKCSYSRKQFARKLTLQRHIRTHTGEKPYTCMLCSKKFSQYGNFSLHVMKHTGEKPHKCTICGSTFRIKNHLVEHERIHTGEKPFNCTYCSKKFTQKSTLIRHIRTHTGEKPYKCDKCSKVFAHLATYNMHVINIHK